MYDNTHFMEMTKVISEPVAFKHTIFLDECIDNTSYYRSAIATLKSASESDLVSIVFDTEGGLCHTASVFESAMRECKAHIKGELCGQVASAGTKLALACDDWVVGDDVVFMCHTASYGASNSAEKLRDQVNFLDKWVTKMNTDTYAGFLTEEELSNMNESGKEYWFAAEDLVERLQNFAEHRQQQQESSLEDLFSSQNEEAEKMEQVLLNKLLEDGKISQEELDIAKRVQKATLELDESLDDEQFNKLMEASVPPESLDDEPEESLCKFEAPEHKVPILYFLREDVDMNIWEVSNNGKFYSLNKDDELYEHEVSEEGFHGWTIGDLKKLCDSFNIKYANNVKNKKILIERLIRDAEKFWKEYVS